MDSGKPDTSLTLRRWHLIVICALLAAAYWFIERRYVDERRELVLQQDDIAQALTRAYIEDKGPLFEHEGALYAGTYRINWSDTLVNSVKADSGCGLTIFQGDERIATTMIKPGTQERAFGTHALPEVKRMVLEEGHAFRGQISDLGEKWLMVVTPLRDGDRNIIGMIGTFRAVEALARELLYFRAMLGGVMLLLFVGLVLLVLRIERQQRESAAVRRGLIEDRAKQHAKFFESMTHELRTPLSTLMVFASSLIDSVQDDRSREVAHRVQTETKELIGVVDDILDYARLEAGNLELHAEEVDVARLVERSVEAVRARAGTRSIRLDVDVQADLPKANGDPARVQQAVTNLLATAILATDEGRVKVRASAERDAIVIDVSDGGAGLSDEQLASIWDPFHASTGATTGRSSGGSGLALSIARGLVTRMGGSVEALSKKGKGTTLRVRLPRAQITV